MASLRRRRSGGLARALLALVLVALAMAPVRAAQNAGPLPAQETLDFAVHAVAQFQRPWAIAVLPDARLLITEKPGRLWLVTPRGGKTAVQGVPAVYDHGQNGLHDVALAPTFDTTGEIYLSFVAPQGRGGVLQLLRARLVASGGKAALADKRVIWRQRQPGTGGQPGAIIAFAPDGRYLFLTVGDRMQPETAQDPNRSRGKILRMRLDGSVPADNPQAAVGGMQALTWSLGHRNPYGLAFDAQGQLWSHEMGPRGGDELNLIQPGRNYGWPLVSNGSQYSGVPIPDHATRPDLEAPRLYWTPVIAPAGMAFYDGDLFPQWQGSALIGGLMARGVVRVVFGADGRVAQAQRWHLGERIRDVAVAVDGAVWLIEDGPQARLLRLTPR